MKLKIVLLLMCILVQSCIKFDNYVNIEENGTGYELTKNLDYFNSQQLQTLNEQLKKMDCDAATIIKNGEIILNYGETKLPMNCASVRKSIFSALYGIAIEKNLIDIDKTLKELGVDDSKQPLTEIEKTATLRMLLQARSGIYLKALGESQSNRDLKPARGSHLPGAYFYYNNWDFNVLPIILENKTGKKIGELFSEWIAKPIGMTYFKSGDVTYQNADYTDFPQTRFYLTCEDLARFGALYANQGKWKDTQIIPSDWIKLSTQTVSKETSNEPGAFDKWKNLWTGYSYLWWTDDINSTYWAAGTGGQFLIVDKNKELVIVLRKNTGVSIGGSAIYNFSQIEIPKNEADNFYYLVKQFLK